MSASYHYSWISFPIPPEQAWIEYTLRNYPSCVVDRKKFIISVASLLTENMTPLILSRSSSTCLLLPKFVYYSQSLNSDVNWWMEILWKLAPHTKHAYCLAFEATRGNCVLCLKLVAHTLHIIKITPLTSKRIYMHPVIWNYLNPDLHSFGKCNLMKIFS